MRTYIVFGDTHMPFMDIDAVTAGYELLNKLKPSKDGKGLVVVQIGDLYDMFAFSKFPRSHNLMTPRHELQEGREMAQAFWRNVKQRVPKAECIQMRGNHDVRPEKRIIEAYPPSEDVMIKGIEDLFRFEGVTTVFDTRQEWISDDICFQHGHFSGIGKHVRYNLMHTVHGHTHRGGVHFEAIKNKIYFELDVGFLGSIESKVLSYTAQRFLKWTIGLGVIDSLGPRFIPFTW